MIEIQQTYPNFARESLLSSSAKIIHVMYSDVKKKALQTSFNENQKIIDQFSGFITEKYSVIKRTSEGMKPSERNMAWSLKRCCLIRVL